MSTSPRSDHDTLHIDEIIPYWRNPRRITSEAVNALAESIRQYGYLQPIAVDENNVIVIGHTRYSALRKLGYEDVDVLRITGLSARQTKELRIVDNRVAEFNEWDHDQLAEEFEKMDSDLLNSLFPELGESDFQQIENDVPTIEAQDDEEEDDGAELICPHCFYSWEISRDDADKLKETADATA